MKIFQEELFNSLPDGIFFDLDNTFYSYSPAHEAAQDSVRAKAMQMFSISKKHFDNACIEARTQIKKQLPDHAASHSRLLYFQRMLEIMGLGSQILLALDFEQTYWRTFLAKARLFEGVKEVLDELRLQGVALAIVTDLTAQIQFRKIVLFELDKFFDCVVTSEEAGFEKPHHAPFLLAENKLRLKNGIIWMVGDSVAKDIRGAKAALGAVTIQKLHTGIKLGQGDYAPDAAFSEFPEFLKLIQKLKRRNV